jgi:hypothetical protein
MGSINHTTLTSESKQDISTRVQKKRGEKMYIPPVSEV